MRLWLRNGIYGVVLLLALPWLVYRSVRTGRYRRGLRQKLFGLSRRDLTDHEPLRVNPEACRPDLIWFHGVSVGEIQLLARLIKQFHETEPRLRFVVSTTTESGMELARKLLPEYCCFYFPADFSWSVRKTLRTLNPSQIVLAELELWPNLIELATRAGIPVVVVNGRLSDRSFRRYQRLGLVVRSTFRQLTCVVAQTETYAERFRHCGCEANRVVVSGSLKFDNVEFEATAPQVVQLRRLVGLQAQDRVLVLGSTQAPEEMAGVSAFVDLRDQWTSLRCIVVPRHPDRFEEVYQSLRQLPIKLMRRSQIQVPVHSKDWEVLLVDSVGELRWWWGLAEIGVVGGSFGNRGGQNMLEPAAYGVNVAFGPNTSNFRDIAELLLENQAACRIPDLEHLKSWIRRQLAGPEEGRRRGSLARDLIAAQQGATARTIELIMANQNF